MWKVAFLYDLSLGDLTAYVRAHVILFFAGKQIVGAAINRRDIYVLCGESAEPPCLLADLYLDFAKQYPEPFYAGFNSCISMDSEGYFESPLETPWDSHPLFCAKKIAARICRAITDALPQPIAEELAEHITGW
jgi:hypothetical protein